MSAGDLWSRLESARNYLLDRGDYSEHGTDTVSATIIEEAQQRIADLESELASLREQVRWRPMEEAPKDGTHVLAFFPDWQCTGEPRVIAVKWTGPPDSKYNWWSIPGYGGLSPKLWREIGPLPGGEG